MYAKMHTLTIPATSYIHTYPKAANLKPASINQEAQTITFIDVLAALARTITIVCEEQILTVGMSGGHYVNIALFRQCSDNAIEQIFNHEYMKFDDYNAQEVEIAEQIAMHITHAEIYKQHRDFMLNEVRRILK